MNELSLWSRGAYSGLVLSTLVALSGCAEPDPNHTHEWEEPTESSKEREPKPSPEPSEEGPSEASGPQAPKQPKDKTVAPPEPTIVHAEAGPEELARYYLTLGAAGDLSRLSNFVDPRCHDGPIGRVDSARLVGTLMDLEGLTLRLESQSDNRAVVNFQLVGGVTAGVVKQEVDIKGEAVSPRTTALTTTGVERRGWLTLKRSNGLWRVSCDHSYGVKPVSSGSTP